MKTARRIAKQLQAVNALLCISPEEQLKAIERVASSNDKIVLDKSDDKISVDHLIANRDVIHSTTNGVNK